ncbi:MAG: F0F1 ATP synthase subunit alpha [Muribaculaceae bacterium]|nr:F0F1 ATP synthase subunit alpha [Muribaculaceae bacterium]
MINPSEISQVLKQQLENVNSKVSFEETGTVLEVGDGVAHVYGLDNVCANELVEFENGVKGVALNLEESNVGVILLNNVNKVTENMSVRRTGQIASINVGDGLFGRVINVLGQPIDGRGPIDGKLLPLPLERKAPGVIFRQPVKQPLQTGIKAIDSMVPIGRGQRELIIGDRQIGKTAIAIDTIINQRRDFEQGKPVYCIYVAIGQKASTVASIVETLRQHGALEYTVVVAATASDSAAMRYYAPFAGVAIGEYIRDTGRDALIVYDDLSKQAVAYREISLVLKRPSGREAYPGDIFYLHSRLLERAAKIIDNQEVASNMNDLPEPLRPIVKISVSRVGGSAQIKSMKKVAGTLKIDQAQFRELESFTKFGGDIDAVTARVIDKGRKNENLLIQPQYSPMQVEDEVALIYCGTKGLLADVPVEKVKDFEKNFLQLMHARNQDAMDAIRAGRLDDDITALLTAAATEVAASYK